MQPQEQNIIAAANEWLASTSAAAVHLPLADGKALYMGSEADIASMLPDIGAAVRGEPVAEHAPDCNSDRCTGCVDIDALADELSAAAMLQTWPENIWLQSNPDKMEEYPGPSEELTWCDCEVEKFDIHYIRADLVAPVSPRAADAPSEPSENAMRAVLLNAKAVIQRWDSPLWRQKVHTAEWINQLRKSVELAESRAADAIDSQPTALRPTDDELWDATLRDRDAYHEWADKLADAIAAHFGVDIGEHSNQNLPWAEALEAIEAASSQPTDGEVRNA